MDAQKVKILERVVNQCCADLVRGKCMRLHDRPEIVNLDKDMLNIFVVGEPQGYPIRSITSMDLSKDVDAENGAVWILEMKFEGEVGDVSLSFGFRDERERVGFALAVRMLRGCDPDGLENELVVVNHIVRKKAKARNALTIELEVEELSLFHKVHAKSGDIYLEFFVSYPARDDDLHAFSGLVAVPPEAIAEELEETEAADEELAILQDFSLEGARLQIPQLPHWMFGRLMSDDEFFPIVLGTFNFEVTREVLLDPRTRDAEGLFEVAPLVINILKPDVVEATATAEELEALTVAHLFLRIIFARPNASTEESSGSKPTHAAAAAATAASSADSSD
eukprot:NODE_14255_length_1119_cov_5.311492.p1 GENE.NODE_14255_length_1119_cov_5.311492~~NODE_14255_length_1119_cov_5.311492.p1  ORF type:complete len:355 (+),score=112.78 NODE_14255_length_1119_cov_5.311492:56-1066(+)